MSGAHHHLWFQLQRIWCPFLACVDSHTCTHVHTHTHPIEKQNLSNKTIRPNLLVLCKTLLAPWPSKYNPVWVCFLSNEPVAVRDTDSLRILFPRYITQCIQTLCFYLLCYKPREGPCVFCPRPLCLNVFPVCTFLEGFICLLFLRGENCDLVGEYWHSGLLTCRFSVHVVSIRFLITTLMLFRWLWSSWEGMRKSFRFSFCWEKKKKRRQGSDHLKEKGEKKAKFCEQKSCFVTEF